MQYENIIIEGGGVKIYASIGVIQELEKRNKLSSIKRIAGTSAGSIIATLLALNCSSEEMKKYYDLVDMAPYKIKYYSILTYYNLLHKKGIHDSCHMKDNVISKILIEKIGRDDITFKEMYDTYGKILVITGTCLNKREIHYYHLESNPNMKIKDAIQISCCIPFLFQPIEWKKNTMVDGAVLLNYPLYFFDDNKNIPNSRKGIVTENTESVNKLTIGIKFIDYNTSKDSRIFTGNDPTKTAIQYISCITNTMVTQIERLSMRQDYWEQTIAVNLEHSISITDMSLSEEQKQHMIKKGIDSACIYFNDKE